MKRPCEKRREKTEKTVIGSDMKVVGFAGRGKSASDVGLKSIPSGESNDESQLLLLHGKSLGKSDWNGCYIIIRPPRFNSYHF